MVSNRPQLADTHLCGIEMIAATEWLLVYVILEQLIRLYNTFPTPELLVTLAINDKNHTNVPVSYCTSCILLIRMIYSVLYQHVPS